MCGLCGVLSTTISDTEFEKFCQLFHVSSLRGEHSSGVFSVKEQDKGKGKTLHSVRYLKSVGSSGWFTEAYWKQLKESIHDSSSTVLVAGHCRHATRGSVSNANAHPFNFSNIIGMHNGTLVDNIGPKVPKPAHSKKGKNWTPPEETDSESFYRFLNDHTIEEALSELRPYQDAYAFVWYDKHKKTLNFIRNNKRPLWFAQIGATLYWASEKEMLLFILNRGYGGGYSATINKLSEVPADTLVSFDVASHSPVHNCKVRKIEVKSKHTYHHTPNHGGFRGWAGMMGEWDESEQYVRNTEAANDRPGDVEVPFDAASGSNEALTSREKFQERVNVWKGLTARVDEKMAEDAEKRGSNVISLPNVKGTTDSAPTYQILDKSYSRNDYQKMLEKGCAWCTCQAEITDSVHWFGSQDYLCESCKDDPEVKIYATNGAN